MTAENTYQIANTLLSEPRMERLYHTARELFRPMDRAAHNWEHVERVILNSVAVGVPENADMSIVMAATILHDLGYVTNPEDPPNHPINGAERCYEHLGEWTPADRDAIAQCIMKHKGAYPGYSFFPETLEERVVCDADQLDKFGWVGFIQMVKVYVEHGSKGRAPYHTLAGIAEGMTHLDAIEFYTRTARDLAADRTEPDTQAVAAAFRNELRFYEEWNRP